jgi:hypothetical protein
MSESPFQILGIAPRFELDAAAIQRTLLRESARRHPDRAPDPVTAASWTDELARLNAAADLVRDDLERAEQLVLLRGGPGPSDDRRLPDGFLESMLGVRMELEEAVASGDEVGRRSLEDWGRREWAERRALVEQLLDGPEGEDAVTLAEVRLQLNCWRYSQRMLEQLDRSGGR